MTFNELAGGRLRELGFSGVPFKLSRNLYFVIDPVGKEHEVTSVAYQHLKDGKPFPKVCERCSAEISPSITQLISHEEGDHKGNQYRGFYCERKGDCDKRVKEQKK